MIPAQRGKKQALLLAVRATHGAAVPTVRQINRCFSVLHLGVVFGRAIEPSIVLFGDTHINIDELSDDLIVSEKVSNALPSVVRNESQASELL